MIALEVHPEDITNFATTNKQVLAASKSALERHVVLQRRFRKIDSYLGGGEYQVDLPVFLNLISEDTWAAAYVKELSLVMRLISFGSLPATRTSILGQRPPGTPLRIPEDAHQAPNYNKIEMISKLLSRLPNLRTFAWYHTPFSEDTWTLLGLIVISARDRLSPTLTNLTTVSLSGSDCRHRGAPLHMWDYILKVMDLPSIRTIKARMTDGTRFSQEWHDQPEPMGRSTLSELIVETRCCQFEHLNKITRAAKALRKLTIQEANYAPGKPRPDSSDLDEIAQQKEYERSLRSAPLDHCQHSLEELEVMSRRQLCLHGLKDFDALRVLRTDTWQVLGEWPGSFEWKAELPVSLQLLQLENRGVILDSYAHTKRLQAMVEELFAEKMLNLHNLNQVDIVYPFRLADHEHVSEVTLEQCRRAGVHIQTSDREEY